MKPWYYEIKQALQNDIVQNTIHKPQSNPTR